LLSVKLVNGFASYDIVLYVIKRFSQKIFLKKSLKKIASVRTKLREWV